MPSECKCSDFLVADLHPGLVVAPILLSFYLEPPPGLDGRDQLDDCPVGDERPYSPVHRDES